MVGSVAIKSVMLHLVSVIQSNQSFRIIMFTCIFTLWWLKIAWSHSYVSDSESTSLAHIGMHNNWNTCLCALSFTDPFCALQHFWKPKLHITDAENLPMRRCIHSKYNSRLQRLCTCVYSALLTTLCSQLHIIYYTYFEILMALGGYFTQSKLLPLLDSWSIWLQHCFLHTLFISISRKTLQSDIIALIIVI